jgi:hypothetical protein
MLKSLGWQWQALDQMGEAVHPLVEAALQGTDHHRWKSAFRYLAALVSDLLVRRFPVDWEKNHGVRDGVMYRRGRSGWGAIRRRTTMRMMLRP